MSKIGLLKQCELCEQYITCNIYEKVCKELEFLRNFLDIEGSNDIAKYCNSYNRKNENQKKYGNRLSIPKEDKELKPFTKYSDIVP